MFKAIIEDISKRENSNDFGELHLYFNSELGMWVAFGPSAYALRVEAKVKNWNCSRSYSKLLDMPCVLIDSEVALSLRGDLPIKEENPEYICFALDKSIQAVEYIRWVAKLKESEFNEKFMSVRTGVSELVPKDQFIPDGMSSISRYAKRVSDFILSLIALIIFSPLFLLCYILVRREDGGPAIYKQERIGRFGRPFYIYKFRSMRLDAEKMGPQLSHGGGEDDPRLTKIGKFIRAHHLDELPQLYNVFCGDMSFVGPRPERKFYIDQILEYDRRYVYLYQIRPGVTSYATLHNGYTDTMKKMLQRLEYDLYYLGHRSAWFDFKILFQTFCRIVFGRIF